MAASAALIATLALASARANLQWESLEAALNLPPTATHGTAEFKFRNTSARTITITGIRADCGCTVAETDRSTYPPAASGTLAVVYDVGTRTGTSERAISVTTDAPGDSGTRLKLRVTAVAALSLDPPRLSWERDETPLPKTVEVTPHPGARVSRIDCRVTPPIFSAQLADPPSPGAPRRLTLTPLPNPRTSPTVRPARFRSTREPSDPPATTRCLRAPTFHNFAIAQRGAQS
jgi:hypothetical protein